jgi:hypothetical protein
MRPVGGVRLPAAPLLPRQLSNVATPVSPFVVLRGEAPLARHHPSARLEKRTATALPLHPPGKSGFLLKPHSPSAGFEAPEPSSSGTGDHPGPRRSSRVIRGLHAIDHVGRGCYPSGLLLRQRVSRLVTIPRRCRGFRGQKPEASPYLSTTVFPSSVSSSIAFTGKGFSPLSWLSFSSSDFSDRRA